MGTAKSVDDDAAAPCCGALLGAGADEIGGAGTCIIPMGCAV